MSFDNHDGRENNFPVFKNKPPIPKEIEIDELKMGSFIKVFLMAKNKSLEDFIKWCDSEGYRFNKQ